MDQEAALRMIRLSGQQGVPVITVDDQVIVGFDRRGLEGLLSREPSGGPRLGAAVADAAPRLQMEGAYVGCVTPGSPAEKAGLRAGDVIIELGRNVIHNAADVERTVASLLTGNWVTLTYVRHGQRIQTALSV